MAVPDRQIIIAVIMAKAVTMILLLFLRKINPRQAVVVHCEKEHSVFEHTIEQEMMSDGESRTQFIFAEEGEIYKL